MDLFVSQTSGLGGTRRTMRLRSIANAEDQDVEIFFDLIGIDAPQPVVLDGFVFGIILYAMSFGQELRVHGAMSFDALANLHEFQEAWHLWRPKKYKMINILPDEIVEPRPPAGEARALAAFSGGVDSLFSILRHNTRMLGNASYPLNDSVLMVHGFDVPLGQPHLFDALKKRTKPFLDELGLTLLTVRTNLKEINLQDWEDSFMSQLACCMHQYADGFSYAIAGSGFPYDSLLLPWGSNPATDHLLSNKAMRLVLDGSGFSRTEKVELVSIHETATRVAKVCWEGKESHRNCGRCEKCVRTLLNFKAVGVDHPACFDAPLDLSEIPKIKLRSAIHLAELSSIMTYVNQHSVEGSWVDLLHRRIKDGVSSHGRIRMMIEHVLRGEFKLIYSKVKMYACAVRFRTMKRKSR